MINLPKSIEINTNIIIYIVLLVGGIIFSALFQFVWLSLVTAGILWITGLSFCCIRILSLVWSYNND